MTDDLPVQISLTKCDPALGWDALLRRADAAMYQDKQAYARQNKNSGDATVEK